MPIPTAQAHDVVLAYLVWRQAKDFHSWLQLADVELPLVEFLAKKGSPGFKSDGSALMNGNSMALERAIRSLERKRFLRYDKGCRRVQLTPLGAYVALLHELPEELDRVLHPTP